MKKVILNLLFLFTVLAAYGQSELYVHNDTPDRIYLKVNYHLLPISSCDVDVAPPDVCLLPGADYMYTVPMGYTVHSARVFNANAGCLWSEVDWSMDGHLIFPGFPCFPSTDFIPYMLTLNSCGSGCQKLLIE